MGLDNFVSFLKKNKRILSCAHVTDPLPDAEQPVVIVDDCMARLTSLRVISGESIGPLVRPMDVVRAFCGPYLDAINLHRDKLKKIYILFDQKEFMSDLKIRVQGDRNKKRTRVDWCGEVTPEHVNEYVIVRDGLQHVPTKKIVLDHIHLRECMLTRYQRPLVYEYLANNVGSYLQTCGYKGRVICSHPRNTQNRIPAIIGLGEAELQAFSVAWEHKHSHSIQIWSGDSDILALGYWFAPLFTHESWFRLKHDLWFSGHTLCTSVLQHGWNTHALLWCVIINGTDFVKRSKLWCRMKRDLLFETTRMYFRHGCFGANPPWVDSDSAHQFVYYILGVRFGLNNHDPPLTWRGVQTLERSKRDTKRKRLYTTDDMLDVIHEEIRHAVENWNYWTTLQTKVKYNNPDVLNSRAWTRAYAKRSATKKQHKEWIQAFTASCSKK